MSHSLGDSRSAHMVANQGHLNVPILRKALSELKHLLDLKPQQSAALQNLKQTKWRKGLNSAVTTSGGAHPNHWNVPRINDAYRFCTNLANLPYKRKRMQKFEQDVALKQTQYNGAPQNQKENFLRLLQISNKALLDAREKERLFLSGIAELTTNENLGIEIANHVSTNCANWIVDQLHDVLHPEATTIDLTDGYDPHAALDPHNPNPEFDEGRQLITKPIEVYLLHIRLISEIRSFIALPNAVQAAQHDRTINSSVFELPATQPFAEWYARTNDTDVLALNDTHLAYTPAKRFSRIILLMMKRKARFGQYFNDLIRSGGIQSQILEMAPGLPQDRRIREVVLQLTQIDDLYWTVDAGTLKITEHIHPDIYAMSAVMGGCAEPEDIQANAFTTRKDNLSKKSRAWTPGNNFCRRCHAPDHFFSDCPALDEAVQKLVKSGEVEEFIPFTSVIKSRIRRLQKQLDSHSTDGKAERHGQNNRDRGNKGGSGGQTRANQVAIEASSSDSTAVVVAPVTVAPAQVLITNEPASKKTKIRGTGRVIVQPNADQDD